MINSSSLYLLASLTILTLSSQTGSFLTRGQMAGPQMVLGTWLQLVSGTLLVCFFLATLHTLESKTGKKVVSECV